MSALIDIETFVAGLPKAELHVHLQGAASVATVLELARRHPDADVPSDEEALRDFYTFRDFAHFIEVYASVNRLVRTADDVRALVTGLGRDLARVNVRYAEVTVTPDSHLLMGIAPDAVAGALTYLDLGYELVEIPAAPLPDRLRRIDELVERWTA